MPPLGPEQIPRIDAALLLLAQLLDYEGILQASSFADELAARSDRVEQQENAPRRKSQPHQTDRIVALQEIEIKLRAADSWSPSLPRKGNRET